MSDLDPDVGLAIIGDELLTGRVADRNGPFLLGALFARGVRVGELRLVGDAPARVAEAVAQLAARYDRVVTTGGIGPTHDDTTLGAVAQALGRPLVPVPAEALWGAEAERLPDARLWLPEGARLLDGGGQKGPLWVVQVDNVLVLPGVPSLVRRAFAALDVWGRGPQFVRVELALGVDELAVAERLRAAQARHPTVAIGSYPQPAGSRVRVLVSAVGRDRAEVAACQATLVAALGETVVAAPPPAEAG